MGTRKGRYGCTQWPIMGFESRALSARVTKQIVTILVKHVINPLMPHFYITKLGFTGVYVFHLSFALNHRLCVRIGY